ncbi:AAA family ATPase [Paenisporosarcina cavernae]|uniref:Tunicamycin resistance protein n=1 Tax=Paenisporosarcina cavernae TaxID=2320858 RepID=A0A385YX22_9BACL|nr:AAA family ATPase [Paenisporosarcina cavernae]AYC30457.1 tunicamycin resistance protein [Paenisporosarcina cavernae]
MILMINGAFGVGKTTISNRLNELLENSLIFDPEEIGYMLRNVLPHSIKMKESESGDFQDLNLWKELTVTTARRIVEEYKVNLIVPMTIRNPEYFHYIFHGFSLIDTNTFHFCLTATKDTIFKRLKQRGEEEGNWCFQQTELCLEAYKMNNFGKYIQTENQSIDDITDSILEKLNFLG